ncbi:MAG: hypothetical protein C4334_04550 [Pyrinomonas sp.]|uniref:hypothetical protein n=1 Tax=Pyrinomonas sp. TaxID=2080306 RepID=UPI00333009FA
MKYLATLVLGALIGGGAVYFLFVGLPRAQSLPGEPLRAPEADGAATTAVITLDERFFNSVIETIFREVGEPSFRLALNGVMISRTQDAGCPSQVTITPEQNGARTFVRLTDGRINAPLAFAGNYNAFGRCINFRGAAQTNIQLLFNRERQTLYGQINVEGISPEGVSPAFAGLIALFVQRVLNDRVNPIEVLRGDQLALNLPVQAAGGALRARVADIRAEIVDGALRLHIIYDFNGTRAQTALRIADARR